MKYRFNDKELETLANTGASRKYRLPDDILERFMRVLAYIEEARTITDLRTPPSLRLEKLKGTRDGQRSMRVNAQYRVIFEYEKHHDGIQSILLIELSKHYE